jgi:hypothetical protein
MELSKKSWHAWLFKAVYDKPLPNNLCDYFWPVMMTAILGVFLWPIYILFNKSNSKMEKYIHLYVALMFYIVISFVVLMFWSNLASKNVEYGYYIVQICQYIGLTGWWVLIGFYLAIYLSVAAIVIVISIFVLGITGIKELCELLPSRKYKEKTPNLLIEWIKAKKHKYCPQITWK